MERRQFIKASVIGGATLMGVSTGAFLLIDSVDKKQLTMNEALKNIDALLLNNLTTVGEWDLFQIFSHCAQSVEYSLTGFPEHKSQFFKSTLGALAFSAFASKGKMTHGLDEAIPGADVIHPSDNVAAAIARLKTSFANFKEFEGDLAPHFAYGQLTKTEYEQAHVMHLYNHFQEIVLSEVRANY